MSYTPLWTVVKDFQSLIGAVVSLIAVVSAIAGIFLKARLDEHLSERRLRDARRTTALSLYSIVRIESSFPESSLLRVPSEQDAFLMLADQGNAAVGVKSYIDYFLNFTSTLAVFPKPISDRAHFLSWVSARVAFTIAAVHNSASEDRDIGARTCAPELRMLLIAGIVVIDELADELCCYESDATEYEKQWSRADLLGTAFRGVHSRRFDMRQLQTRVWEVSLMPSAGLESAVAMGTQRRRWLETLVEKIRRNIRGDRKVVDKPLQGIYEYCKKLPRNSPETQLLERLVVAIWKRGDDPVDENSVLKLDPDVLGLVSDLAEQASRSWRL